MLPNENVESFVVVVTLLNLLLIYDNNQYGQQCQENTFSLMKMNDKNSNIFILLISFFNG